MKNKVFAYLIFSFFSLTLLVYYNYHQAQIALRDVKSSPLSISVSSPANTATKDQLFAFNWVLDASPDQSTSFTTIYWGYSSSPSALTKDDSPLAVGYPNHLVDFTSGHFKLPSDFQARARFTKLGKIYYRAYARVRDNHLWSDEKSLEVKN